jgi:uncharacterized membrane protein
MSTKLTTILVLILIAAAVIAGVLFWDQLPEQMASHWNENDEVDGYMSKFWGVWMMPLVTLGMFALFLVIPNIDPLKANIAQIPRRVQPLHPVHHRLHALHARADARLEPRLRIPHERRDAAIHGHPVHLHRLYARQAKRNWFIGIRTPWTLSSDTVWDKTHQLGSWLFIAAGVFAFAGAFFGGATAMWLTLIPAMGSALFVVVYSFVLYQRETKGQ